MSGTVRPSAIPTAPVALLDEEEVAAIVRDLARELGGPRAARAVTPTASLEREVGLGSIERVELLTRIEEASGLELSDRFLLLDSARDLAAALPSARAAGLAVDAPVAAEPSASIAAPPPAAVATGALEHRDVAASHRRGPMAASAVASHLRHAIAATARVAYVVYLVPAWMLAIVLTVPPLWMLSRVLPAGARVRRLTRFACRLALAITGCRVRVDGAERVPDGDAVVFAANHTSFADVPALAAAIPRDFVFVAMQEIMRWPVVSGFVRRSLHPTVDRWHPQRSVADAAAIQRRLRDGDAVLFFPEGGFGAARGLRPLRLGAFEAAAVTGAALVPVALRGGRHVLPAGARLPRPGRIDVWIGEPLFADGDDWRAVVDLRDRAADAIAAHADEPRFDLAPQPPVAEEPV